MYVVEASTEAFCPKEYKLEDSLISEVDASLSSFYFLRAHEMIKAVTKTAFFLFRLFKKQRYD
jgi:hypothetical protein